MKLDAPCRQIELPHHTNGSEKAGSLSEPVGARRTMENTSTSVRDILERKPPLSRGSQCFFADRWFPIGLVFLNAILSTAAEVLLKIGASQPLAISFPSPITALSVIASGWVLLGIIAYVGSLFLWLAALSRLPLHLAYGLASSVHLFVPCACWFVLHETIPFGRLLGMLFILAGIVLLGFSHVE
jgi:multidrug transporter EmrE-like cation transporter